MSEDREEAERTERGNVNLEGFKAYIVADQKQ